MKDEGERMNGAAGGRLPWQVPRVDAEAPNNDEEDGAAGCGEEMVGVMTRGVGIFLCQGQE